MQALTTVCTRKLSAYIAYRAGTLSPPHGHGVAPVKGEAKQGEAYLMFCRVYCVADNNSIYLPKGRLVARAVTSLSVVGR